MLRLCLGYLSTFALSTWSKRKHIYPRPRRAHNLDGRVSFRKENFGNLVEATRVARHNNLPGLAAAVLKPGRRIWINVNDLHFFIDNANDTDLRETAGQIGIQVTGRLWCCDGRVGRSWIRKAINKSDCGRAEKQIQRLYADVEGAVPTSTGGVRYCLVIVDDATNVGWPVIAAKKSTATVTLGASTFLVAVNANKQPDCLGQITPMNSMSPTSKG